MIRETIGKFGKTYQTDSEDYILQDNEGNSRSEPYHHENSTQRYLLSYDLENNYFYQFPSGIIENNELTQGIYNDVYNSNSTEWKTWEIVGLLHLLDLDEIALVLTIPDTLVYTGQLYDFDLEYCEQNNLHVIYEVRNGGTIVYSPGDVIMSSSYKTNEDEVARMTKLTSDAAEWFRSKGLNAVLDNNDILINGTKVCSNLSTRGQNEYSDVGYIGLSFYINTDLELIQNVCLKECEKTPGRLSDFGITTEEVIEWAQNWIYNNPSK